MSEITLRFCGADRPLVFKWRALAQLREKFGIDFQGVVARAMMEQDFITLAEIVSAGSGVPAADVLEDSPPVAAAIGAIQAALGLAYHGPRVEGLDRPLAAARGMLARVLAMFTPKRLTHSLA